MAAGPKKSPPKKGFVPFQKSKFDKDAKGTKEGNPAAKAADKKQMPAFLAAKKGKK